VAERIYFFSAGFSAGFAVSGCFAVASPGIVSDDLLSAEDFSSPPGSSTGRDCQQFDLFDASDPTEINLN
jgi:hypothetical protein